MTLFLSLLLLVSGFVRGYLVSSVPPELFGDEVDVGYQAYSLYKTGKDLYGQPIPAYIHSLSEWRMPLIMYLTVPSIAVLGNTTLAVRLPEVVFGALGPLILALLVWQTTRNKTWALLSGVALALMPWHIHYSRTAFEVVILIDLLMLGVLCLIRKKLLLSLLFFVLTLYTYSTIVVFLPLISLALFFLYRPRIRIYHVVVGFILLIPFTLNIISGQAGSRFGIIGIFNDQKTIDKIITYRQGMGIAERAFHNKVETFLGTFTNNYLNSFSFDFLFTKGDPIGRHGVQVAGPLLSVTSLLLVIGLGLIVKNKQWIWIVWLVSAPIPSALTVDGGSHATRLFLLVVPLAVCIGAGGKVLWETKSRLVRSVAGVITLIILFQFVWVSHYYLNHYPGDSWRWWHIGYRDTLTHLVQLDGQYNRIYINNTYEPALIRFLFYTKYDPARFQQKFQGDKPQMGLTPQYDGFILDERYVFGTFSAPYRGEIDRILVSDSLYMISQREEVPGNWDWELNPPSGVKVLYVYRDPSGNPLFYLATGK